MFFRCEDMRQDKDAFVTDDKVQFVIDAVYAIAHALQVGFLYKPGA